MEQLFFAGKAYLKINSLVKTPLHDFMAVERFGLWAPGRTNPLLGSLGHLSPQLWLFSCILRGVARGGGPGVPVTPPC